ncbi:hypothetical protein Tsubulata_048411, partial [Turnera subulata]
MKQKKKQGDFRSKRDYLQCGDGSGSEAVRSSFDIAKSDDDAIRDQGHHFQLHPSASCPYNNQHLHQGVEIKKFKKERHPHHAPVHVTSVKNEPQHLKDDRVSQVGCCASFIYCFRRC